MTKTQAGRLLTLAFFLRTQVPKEHFDMSSFYSDPGEEDFRDGCENLKSYACGTTACALGWAPVALPDDFLMTEGVPEAVNIRKNEYSLFGIDFDDWDLLFSEEHNRTPKQEAAVIERFVRSKGWVYA